MLLSTAFAGFPLRIPMSWFTGDGQTSLRELLSLTTATVTPRVLLAHRLTELFNKVRGGVLPCVCV